jgi:hypothetical protein
MRISLIATYHAECGAVTAMALRHILDRIRPGVIFAEIPETHLQAWRDGSHGTVESIAAASYCNANQVEIVAVDLPKPDDSFFRDHEEVYRLMLRTSPALDRLVGMNTDALRRGGFAYLNSEACIESWAAIQREELDTIDYIPSSRLKAMYAETRSMTECREAAMIENINSYCSATDRTRGVFLVGASHRKSLIDRIQTADTAASHIEWDLSGTAAHSV